VDDTREGRVLRLNRWELRPGQREPVGPKWQRDGPDA
jgi:hypothetical protein